MNIDFSLKEEEKKWMKAEVSKFLGLLVGGVKKKKAKADVFVGGSYAKGTLACSEEYDIDVFVRFDWKYEDLSYELEKILKGVFGKKYVVEKLHGSRDYFRIYRDKKLTFEVIPVVRIKKVREARNVTDLSYFHVGYVKRNVKGKIGKEILLAKKFCKGVGVYGAESYIGGFSGYGLECLIINYKSFEKMLRELIKVENRVVLDPAKLYRKKEDILIELNESKLHSPIILIDPTWKERNVLAALSMETFRKFQTEAKEYLKSKDKESFFRVEKFDVEKFKKKKGEFVKVVLETDRQEGDIAGTKMKKFSKFLIREAEKYFEVIGSAFVYFGEKKAEIYLIGKAKKEFVKMGPPVEMVKEVKRFRSRNKGNIFEREGRVWVREKVDFSLKEFIKEIDKKVVREMRIVKMRVI
ncbi:MAG: nucleotidyltransferase domain-containing protein [archaeon]